MIPWELIAESPVPGEDQTLTLRRRGDEYAIRLGTQDLMNSRMHFSEEELARFVCELLPENPRILIGGLGMGFTLRSALNHAKGKAEIIVCELLPAVTDWNQKFIGHLADHPIRDPRVQVVHENVFKLIRAKPGFYHGILLDVDNGPSAFTSSENDSLYTGDGLRAITKALKPGGVLGVWSAASDNRFRERLIKNGFLVEEHKVFAREGKKGNRHTVWTAQKTV